jgi:hypothetical protein
VVEAVAISPTCLVEAATVANTMVGSIDMKERYSMQSVIAGVSARKIASSFPGYLRDTHIVLNIEAGMRIAVRQPPGRSVGAGVQQIDVEVKLTGHDRLTVQDCMNEISRGGYT